MNKNYRINISVEIEETDENLSNQPIIKNDGKINMTISEADAISIDKIENAVMQTNMMAIRNAVAKHLSEISKKKAIESSPTGKIYKNMNPYSVDGEIGRYEFDTYLIKQDDNIVYNNVGDLFPPLRGKGIYKTIGYHEIAMIYGDTEKSYRKTAKLINRVRYQEEGGTPHRTIRENTETEGRKVLEHIEENTKRILTENGFSEDGKYNGGKESYSESSIKTITEERVIQAVERLQGRVSMEDAEKNPVIYEDPEQTVNVSIDDVVVKKQKNKREKDKGIKKEKKERIHNTVAHIEKGEENYILNGYGTKPVLTYLIALLINSQLLGNRIQFFTDGYTKLNEAVLKQFNWYTNIGLILDWYHLIKKCKELLSLSMKGRFIRKEVLEKIMPLLWNGKVPEAIRALEIIEKDKVKNHESLEKLIEYLKRNEPYIPCYAVRKELGLRNSSNKGEKINDLIVSERQKHNGMSWSKVGSAALASITSIKRNNESRKWFEERKLNFKLAA